MTPDLITRMDAGGLTRVRAREIRDLSKNLEPSGFEVKPWLWLRPCLVIPDFHDYLADSADWNAETWDIEPEGLDRLGVTVRWLFEQLPDELSFQAVWASDKFTDSETTRNELLEVIARDEIGTHTRYVLPAANA